MIIIALTSFKDNLLNDFSIHGIISKRRNGQN